MRLKIRIAGEMIKMPNRKKSITLKELNEFAKENGLSEDVELYVFGRSMLRAVTEISTEAPAEDALYTDIYLRSVEESSVN